MDENFFIEDPLQLENNFFNQEIKKEFNQNFKQKSQQIVEVASMKKRHAKKVEKNKRQHQQQQKS